MLRNTAGRSTLFAFMIVTAAGCGDSTPDASVEGGETGDAVVDEPIDAGAAAGGTEGPVTAGSLEDGGVELVVAGGAAAGTHRADGETVCVWNDGAWVLGYSRPDVLETQAVLEGLPERGGTTRRVRLSAAVGRAQSESAAVLVLSTDTQGTTASATLQVRDGVAEAELEGASADGVRVNARFRCSFVAS